MSVTRQELDNLFNSSNNDLKDKAIKTMVEDDFSAKKQPEVKQPVKIEQSVNAEKQSKTEKPKNSVTEIEDEDNFGIKGKSFKDKKKDPETIDDVESDVLDIKSGEIESEDFVEEEVVKSSRIPFEEDGEDETVELKQNVKTSNVKVESKTESKNVEEQEEIVENNAIRTDLKKLCTSEHFLDDPRYVQFYKEKKRAKAFLDMHAPAINYDKLEKELFALHLPVNEEKILTLGDFNEKIQKLQAVRNRLSEIRSISIKDYVLKKRIVKLLEDCLMKQSPEKSSDRRTGEIQIHMADMEYDLALSEGFFRDIDQIIENTTCAHEALSRQITCFQERNKEINRGQEPILDNSNTHLDSLLSTSPTQTTPKKNNNLGYKNWDKIV